MAKNHLALEDEEPPGESILPKPTAPTCDQTVSADSCADLTPTNAELLKLADKFPPPAEWQQADDVDSFFDEE
jgi:hypothetical protein